MNQDNVLGPNSIDDELIEVTGEWDTRVRPLSELIEELRREARLREQQDVPPTEGDGAAPHAGE